MYKFKINTNLRKLLYNIQEMKNNISLWPINKRLRYQPKITLHNPSLVAFMELHVYCLSLISSSRI